MLSHWCNSCLLIIKANFFPYDYNRTTLNPFYCLPFLYLPWFPIFCRPNSSTLPLTGFICEVSIPSFIKYLLEARMWAAWGWILGVNWRIRVPPHGSCHPAENSDVEPHASILSERCRVRWRAPSGGSRKVFFEELQFKPRPDRWTGVNVKMG